MRRSKQWSRGEDGFSLVELIVVIIILAVLVAISILTYVNQRETAQTASARQALRNVSLLAEVMRQEGEPFSSDLAEYDEDASGYDYVDGATPSEEPQQVSVHVNPAGDVSVFAARAGTRCFYLRLDTRGERVRHRVDLGGATQCRGSEFESGAGSGWD